MRRGGVPQKTQKLGAAAENESNFNQTGREESAFATGMGSRGKAAASGTNFLGSENQQPGLSMINTKGPENFGSLASQQSNRAASNKNFASATEANGNN